MTIPLELQIEGARSEVNVEMVGPQYELKDYRIALEGKRERGWGRVSIPADANPADNDFYFVFDKPAPRKAIIVAEDPQAAWPLQLAAAISPDPAFACAAEVVPIEQLAGAAWEQTSLLLWQAPLPQGSCREAGAIVRRAGRAGDFPSAPRRPATRNSSACDGERGWTAARKLPSKRGAAIRICWRTR